MQDGRGKIYKPVEKVEGIYLIKIRQDAINYGDQFTLDDPYGHDSGGNQYILNFLKGFYHQRSAASSSGSPARLGYRFVEAVDPSDGRRYRYTGRLEEPWQNQQKLL
jgi:hypothetical protein